MQSTDGATTAIAPSRPADRTIAAISRHDGSRDASYGLVLKVSSRMPSAAPVRATFRAAPKVPEKRTKAAVIYTTVLRGKCECCGKNRRVEWFGGARLPEPTAPLVGGYWDQEDVLL